ncbi:MAG: ParB/RepB/Spo0J family partition protein [Acidobacteria bacterium]|nr:MAG: ParB/RepB/Spo0J family partition protein [Acidobacteriota bacterium]
MNKPASPPPVPRKALGRGLDALLARPAAAAAATQTAPAHDRDLREIPVALVDSNPHQPRRQFDETELEELASSIRTQGVLQPILVRPKGQKFELIAGERRLRAAKKAGLEQIPAIVRVLPDLQAMEVTIIENLQRADLNPIEQATGFQHLAQRFGMTQEDIARVSGKDRATVANFLRLLRLEADVVELVRSGKLTPGQARPLLALAPETQRELARKIAAEAWPARRVEQHVAKLQAPPAPAQPAPVRDPNEREAELQLARALGTRVELKPGPRGRGAIVVNYASLDEFQRLFERLTHS